MNKGKTNYTFQFKADAEVVEDIVKGWLSANMFKLVNKYGEDFYYFYDPVMYGKRGFQYEIDGNTISVNAWTIGIGKKYYMLESGAINNMAGDAYKSLLKRLFNEISAADSADNINVNITSDTNGENISTETNGKDYTQTFELENIAKREKLCNIGFVLSIIGLILSLIGVSYGLIVYLLDFYFASQGVKTEKKGKAIATIVLSIISLVITIYYILV